MRRNQWMDWGSLLSDKPYHTWSEVDDYESHLKRGGWLRKLQTKVAKIWPTCRKGYDTECQLTKASANPMLADVEYEYIIVYNSIYIYYIQYISIQLCKCINMYTVTCLTWCNINISQNQLQDSLSASRKGSVWFSLEVWSHPEYSTRHLD